jgi:Na+/proline symporter
MSGTGTYQNRAAFLVVLGFYVCWMLSIAIGSYVRGQGRQKKRGSTQEAVYEQHFMGGKAYGGFMLFAGTFSSVFSGYTVIGVPAEAAGLGFFALRWLTSCAFVLVAINICWPRWYQLSRYRNYMSSLDYVTDRFDNQVLTIMIALVLMTQSVIYVVANMKTLHDVIPVVSDGQMDTEATVWCFGLVIWICEVFGGLDAVAATDGIQSVIMIISLIAAPCIMHHDFGGAAHSVDYKCQNYVELDCTTAEFTARYPGASCTGSAAYKNGCLADTSDIWTLHPPGSSYSRFWKHAWGNKHRNETAYYTSLYHDGSHYYNNQAWGMLSFGIAQFAFFQQPHWTQRMYAGKSAYAVKVGHMVMSTSSLVATLPGLLVGIMIAANLKAYNGGVTPYSMMLTYLMDKGGFSEFIGVMTSVSAVAAIMSTTDSAILGVANVFSRDIVQNWLFRVVPSLKGTTFLMVSGKLVSLVTIIIGITVVLYDDELHDDPSVYGNLLEWQACLLWQALPVLVVSPFWSHIKAWPAIIGWCVGMSIMIGLWQHQDNQVFWGTEHSVEKVGGLEHSSDYAKAAKAGVTYVNPTETPFAKTYFITGPQWAGFVNLFVTFALSYLPFPDEMPAWIRVGTKNHSPDGSRLTKADIEESVAHVVEPIRNPLAKTMMAMALVFSILSHPWFGDDYSNCDKLSFGKWKDREGLQPLYDAGTITDTTNLGDHGLTAGTTWPDLVAAVGDCEGPELTGGLPTWAVGAIAAYIISMGLNLVATSTWKGEEQLNYYGKAWPTDMPPPAHDENGNVTDNAWANKKSVAANASEGLKRMSASFGPSSAAAARKVVPVEDASKA